MTTPNTQPTELDRTIAYVLNVAKSKGLGPGNCYETVCNAAKRLKDVKKERDAYFKRLGAHATAILNLEQELSTLRTENAEMSAELGENAKAIFELRTGYKQALGLLKICEKNGHTLWCAAGDQIGCLCGFEEIKKHLSTPLAIATMKGNQ